MWILLGGRPIDKVLISPFRARNYAALLGMMRVLPDFPNFLIRYLTEKGSYPYRLEVRTPTGNIVVTLYNHHDLLTANEIFCREDYRVPHEIKIVVDIGSNIGLSALYFLTRNRTVRCHLFEPDPRNLEKLRLNLRGFEQR